MLLCQRTLSMPASAFLPPVAQHRIDLDQMDAERVIERRQHAQCAQRVGHHGAAAGAEFDQMHVLRRAHVAPYGRGPEPEQFAEHLADFRRGGEVALAAERIA